MKRWNILILIMLVLMPLVNAELPFCGNMQKIDEGCRLITPSLECSTNATIINSTGSTKEVELNYLNSSIYYINFNETEGDYVIQLCNNATAYIKSIIQTEMEESNNMLAILFINLIIVGFFVVLAFMSKEFWLSTFNFGFAGFELFLTLFMVYENYVSGNLDNLLEFNIGMLVYVGLFLALITIFHIILSYATAFQTRSSKWDTGIWKK